VVIIFLDFVFKFCYIIGAVSFSTFFFLDEKEKKAFFLLILSFVLKQKKQKFKTA
jgi:hypothetical protein